MFPRGRNRRFLFGGLEDAEILRAEPAPQGNAFRRQASFQELSNSGGAAWHSFVETPIVERHQFLIREHDLQTFAARQAVWRNS